ncbi:hypothetical protein BC826DRAFT_1050040 [Russula brevipes]|nr:hypothetical protein BC826DRAFT_1050040 [Russula brevipes]
MVCDDDLWMSLKVNLWNARRSDGPNPDQFRTFEDCCTVLDVAFSALEDSSKVDWRAPEFGSLTQHFELFITHCFQSTFMLRTTSFRLGMIKARFCKALLSQFRHDVDREAGLVFRSQWDVASLARLFWPLLIICKLAQLVINAVPLGGSSLGTKDIERVRKLQENIVKNKRLPLTRASHKVWGELDQLRNQVNNLCGKNTGDDGETLQRLLGTIDDVRDVRTSQSNERSPGEHAEVQGSMPSAAVNPTLLLRELRDGRPSFASESTAFTGGRFCTTPTSEEDFGGINQNDDVVGHDIGPPEYAIMNGTIGAYPFRIPLAGPHFPCIGDTEECAPPATPPTRRNSSRMSASSLALARRHRPSSPPNPATSSSYTSFDFGERRKSGLAPNTEAGKDE